MNALTTLEPIPLPDLRKPTETPCLPVWLATQQRALLENLQINPETGRYQDLMTLPADRIPSDAQRAAIARHLSSLSACLEQTPSRGDEWVKETLTVVTKMLLVLGGAKASELAAEAKAEAYMAALEDVPSWAVSAVQWRWYRGACGDDENGRPYDYRFMPDPAGLRRLALVEVYRLKARAKPLETVLVAVPYVDCSRELERGRAAWSGLQKTMPSGEDAIRALTFEKAVEIGRGTGDQRG